MDSFLSSYWEDLKYSGYWSCFRLLLMIFLFVASTCFMWAKRTHLSRYCFWAGWSTLALHFVSELILHVDVVRPVRDPQVFRQVWLFMMSGVASFYALLTLCLLLSLPKLVTAEIIHVQGIQRVIGSIFLLVILLTVVCLQFLRYYIHGS
jgi:hypothetical protein